MEATAIFGRTQYADKHNTSFTQKENVYTSDLKEEWRIFPGGLAVFVGSLNHSHKFVSRFS